MSRPTGSVPRMKSPLPPACQTGGVSVNSRYCSYGGCGATTPAKIASRTSATVRARPSNAPRLCAYARQNSRQGPSIRSGAASRATAAKASLIAPSPNPLPLPVGEIVGPDSSGRSSSGRVRMNSHLRMANAWVHDAVEQIDDEIHADHDGGDQEDAALDHRIVARLHAVNEPVAHAGPGENRFGQDRAG